MQIDVSSFTNLGTPKVYFELLSHINNGSLWDIKEVKSFFYNRSIDGQTIFDGCVPLLIYSGILKQIDGSTVGVNYKYRNKLQNVNSCANTILESFLHQFSKENYFLYIFSSKNISFNVSLNAIVIKHYAFGFKFSNIRKFLINFNFLQSLESLEENFLIVNPDLKDFFETNFVDEIRTHGKTLEDLKEDLLKKETNGLIAEQFVLKYESIRLKNKKGILWVAPYNVNAGYDILSFANTKSIINDLYIEVKSYSGNVPYFYWSQNEIKAAEELGDLYSLYLVNRDNISVDRYCPEIISNPAIKILNNNEWKKSVDSYYINKVT